jgi:hypothetical protein
VSTSIIKGLVELDIDPKVAKLVPLFLIVPINYFVLNFIVFKKKLSIFCSKEKDEQNYPK